MANTTSSARAICPYYLRAEITTGGKATIICEGVSDNSETAIIFRTRAAITAWMENNCESYQYDTCPYAKMMQGRYQEREPMIRQKFVIPFTLPSLNDYVCECRQNAHAGAAFKRSTDDSIAWVIKPARLQPVKYPCLVLMVFTEPNRRRDVDNVESAKKYILDALVKCSVIQDDSPRWVVGVPSYTVYGERARVEVTIIESEDTDALRTLLRASAAGIRG